MAKKNSNRRNAETVPAQENIVSNGTQEPTLDGAGAGGNGTITLTLKGVQKNGIATYTREGVNASVYFNKSMFVGAPPASVQITADTLTAPGTVTAGRSSKTPEELKALAETAQAKAQKSADRAAKALAKAQKLMKRAGIEVPADAAVEDVPAEM